MLKNTKIDAFLSAVCAKNAVFVFGQENGLLL